MQSEKLRSQDNYDNKVSYGKLMPRRAENFWTQLITEGILELRCVSFGYCLLFVVKNADFPYSAWFSDLFLPSGIRSRPTPSPLRILIVPVTAAKRNKRSMLSMIQKFFKEKINDGGPLRSKAGQKVVSLFCVFGIGPFLHQLDREYLIQVFHP